MKNLLNLQGGYVLAANSVSDAGYDNTECKARKT